MTMKRRMTKALTICLIIVMCMASMSMTAWAGEEQETGVLRQIEKIGTDAAVSANLQSDAATYASTEDDNINLIFSGTFDYDKAYQVLSIVNQERAKAGLSPLKMDKTLMDAAMQRAAETGIYFSHTRPNGESCFSILNNYYGALGENIAAGQTTASSVMTAWMNSSGHRGNILGSDYQSVGIGCFYQPGGRIFWVQMFGSQTSEGGAANLGTIIGDAYVDAAFENLDVYSDVKEVNLSGGQSKTLNFYNDNLEFASTIKLSPYNATYYSENNNVASVDVYGKVTGVGKGSTVIHAVFGETQDIVTEVRFNVNVSSGSGKPLPDSVLRLYGQDRYDTAIEIASMYGFVNGTGSFDAIIVADGRNYADALAGSYLAKVKNAPILVVGNDNISQSKIRGYISSSLNPGGTVYILGGEGAVSKTFEKSLSFCNVKRLGGKDRFETNIKILKEAGVTNEDILVCSGMDFADSLSASAVGKPILLVDKQLSSTQKTYLRSLSSKNYYIIGGTGAVVPAVEKQVKTFGKTRRISGANRYATSVAVAREFFGTNSEGIVLAYGLNFPDGLAGGPLAMSFNVPLILATSSNTSDAAAYMKNVETKAAMVLGGSALISDEAINKIL